MRQIAQVNASSGALIFPAVIENGSYLIMDKGSIIIPMAFSPSL
jgi:hypothetical protein